MLHYLHHFLRLREAHEFVRSDLERGDQLGEFLNEMLV